MVKYNHETKHIHRPVPCPYYDVSTTESWLESMAREGLLLARNGFFLGFADFEVSKPCAMKYRLQAAKTPKPAFDEGEPDEEESELSEAMGWEFVARRGEFHVYRSSDPNAPELNTDPEVQALSLKAVSKRQRSLIVSILLWLIVYPLVNFDAGLVRGIIATGFPFAIFTVFMLAWIIARNIRALVKLRALRKRLLLGEQSQSSPPRRAQAIGYISSRWLFVLVVLLWAAMLIGTFVRASEAERPIDEFEGEPPFATLSDFWPEGIEYEAVDIFNYTNVYEYLSDPIIAPESIIWREAASIELPDHSEAGGSLTLYYHEMSHPLLAKIVAWEMLRDAKFSKFYKEAPTPELDLEYVAVYYDHFPNVLLRDGNIVLQASYIDYSDEELRVDEIAQILAESIKE